MSWRFQPGGPWRVLVSIGGDLAKRGDRRHEPAAGLTRWYLLAIILATMGVTGASAQHASRQDMDACKLEAARVTLTDPNTGTPTGPASGSEDDRRVFEAIAACLKSKGYVRVEDIGGVCDDFILPQCFERN